MEEQSKESKLVQQHLANERTYLAWIRTSITVVGLGFLAAGVVFGSTPYQVFVHSLAVIVGIGAVLLGGGIMALATRDYMTKRRGINNDQFRSTTLLVWFIFGALGFIVILLVILIIVLLLY